MHHYDICFRLNDGSLAARVTVPAPSDKHAKILAHALKERAYKALEVWEGETLVYERARH